MGGYVNDVTVATNMQSHFNFELNSFMWNFPRTRWKLLLHFIATPPPPHNCFILSLWTYNSLLYPFMMRIKQWSAKIHSQLWRVNEFVQFFDLRAYYHFEAEFLFEKLAAYFRDCFLEKAGRSYHENTLNESGKKILRREKLLIGFFIGSQYFTHWDLH